MVKGKPSFGKMQTPQHTLCRRCGQRSYNKTDKRCSACGFGRSSKLRSYAWQNKRGLGREKK